MQQEQPQYYRAVPVSEKPKKPDLYHTLIEHEILDIEGLPSHNNYIGDANGGYWEIDGEAKVTHYLEPIPIPDAERLREALEKLIQFNEGMVIGLEAEYGLESEAIEIFRPQIKAAREALSAVGDGWVRCEDGLPKAEDADERGYVMVYRRDDRQWGWPTSQGFSKWKRVTPSTHTHWRPLPSPPLNK